jgi:hypothetical protein
MRAETISAANLAVMAVNLAIALLGPLFLFDLLPAMSAAQSIVALVATDFGVWAAVFFTVRRFQ